MNSEKYLFVDISTRIFKILYIDEIKKYMKISFTIEKEWFNSYLTFQNLNKTIGFSKNLTNSLKNNKFQQEINISEVKLLGGFSAGIISS